MDHYTSSSYYNSRSEDQEEQLYCSGLQDLEDILCEGSDTEQTADEIAKKRLRYEEVARRYLCGHRPLIQSASLRGPLHQESGWINPWRQHRRKDADWWQPESEDMLFTRENVMRRAAEHGLGYLSPAAALAWCKAAAKTEAWKDVDYLDSMEAVQYSEESDSDKRAEELLSGSFPEPITKIDKAPQPGNSLDHAPPQNHIATAPIKTNRNNCSKDGKMRGSKRSAGLQWLKGSYVSKKARWEDPLSSPTPMPQPPSDRARRRCQSSARSTDSETGCLKSVSQPTTLRSHDAQRRSRYSGSTAQEPESKDRGGQYIQLAEGLDELHESSRDSTLLSAPEAPSCSQIKAEGLLDTDPSFSKIEPGDILVRSAKDTSSNAPAKTSGTFASQRSGSQSKESPKLPRTIDGSVDAVLADEDSFITEVAPPSRNLEKFQFRKKRPKHKQQPFRYKTEEADMEPKLILGPASADMANDSLSPVISVTNGSAQRVPSESLARGFSPCSEESVETNTQFGLAISSEKDLTAMQRGVSPNSITADDSYLRKVAMMSVDLLPHLQITSPFSMFRQVTSFGVNPSSPVPEITSTDRSDMNELEDGVRGLASNRLEDIQQDNAPVASFLPEIRSPATSNLSLLAEPPHETREPPVDSATKSEDLILQDDDRELLEATRPGHAALAVENSAPPGIEDLNEAPRPQMEASSKSPSKTQPMSEFNGRNAIHTQDTSIDNDSTQSFNSTAPKTLQKLHTSPEAACDDVAMIHTEEPFDISNDQALRTRGKANTDIVDKALLNADNPEETVSSAEKLDDEMEIIQNALSQGCRGPDSSNSTRSDTDDGSQLSVSAAIIGPDPETTTPVSHDDENQAASADEHQDSWEGCGPQSPWAAENLLPEATLATNQSRNAFVSATKQEESSIIGSSPIHASDEGDSGWQPVERPVTPYSDGITPFKQFMTPTPSPERPKPGVLLKDDEIANTQQLIEAATTNPWTSKSRQCSSRKSKKRVSFGCLPSEGQPDSGLETSHSPELRPASPPPPQVSDQAGEEGSFDDSTTVLNKFKDHFSAAAQFKHRLRRNNMSQLSSPAVGAMAERFIAADGQTSPEQRQVRRGESPTRHLQPKSDARTNLSPEVTGYDMMVNLDDFLGDAGSLLEDWSVDSEVKKINDSKGKRDGRGDSSAKRRLFGVMTDIWS